MKKVLFVAHSLQSGGIERALINILRLIDYSEWNISLLLLRNEGENLSDLPPAVHLLSDYMEYKWTNIFCSTWRSYLKKSILTCDLKGIYTVCVYITRRLVYQSSIEKIYEPFLKDVEIINTQFDLAIDFYGGGSITTFITDQKIKANKKITWIHSEAAIKKVKNMSELYENFARVFCVSKRCVKLFKDNIPLYANRCMPFYNYVPVDEIKKKANCMPQYVYDNSFLNLLTVGRISPEKGQFLALGAAYELKKCYPNLKWKWYMIGNGPSLPYLKFLSKIMKLSDECIFTGYIKEPYSYINNCDIYIQPSQFEGYCTTITEASILCKPIIATNVSGVEEQIDNGEDGIIINYDKNELYQSILKLIKSPDLRLKFINIRKKRQYNFEREIEKIQEVLLEH